MAEEQQSLITETIHGIHDVMIQPGSENSGIRRVGLRGEIDTSPPFGSVQEAVTRFGGRGYWVPFKLHDNFNGDGEFDIKRMEEHAAELEKDLIVKELETLDVLEALGSTKRIVEDLKRQLHQESLRSSEHLSSDIKEMNDESQHCHHHNPMPSSPDMILMELKQAKMNLGKTMDDLVVIQSSVETLNKKMKEEKDFLDKTRAKLTYGFGGPVSLAEELSRVRVKPQVSGEGKRFIGSNPPREQVKMVAETDETVLNQQSKNCLRTAEMRLIAARKMEEAARAAEALAIAEIAMLSSSSPKGESEDDMEFCFPEPPRSPITPRGLRSDNTFSTDNNSRRGIMKKLEEATEGVKHSKQALEAALNRVEMANVKQLAAENAFRGWSKDSSKGDNITPLNQTRRSFFSHLNKQHDNNLTKPVVKSNVSMRDVLRRKQVPKEDVVVVAERERQSIEEQIPKRNANLSQMLKELKQDMKFSARAEKEEEVHEEKQFVAQRRKFGFIHITLPMQKQSKKKSSL